MSKISPRCLLVDDDDEIRASVADYLGRFGMAVTTAADGRALRQALRAELPDVVVLDVMLPDESGLDLCRWLRAERPALPVIMLTAQGDPASRIVGLELGADDYIAKPFEPRELVARIHAVLRRSARGRALAVAAESDETVRFQGWRFERALRQLVSAADVVVPLSSAECRLLTAFVERPGRLLSRERLLELTRAAGVEVSDRSIDVIVSRLRQKLGDPPQEPKMIRTVRGEGYVFDVVLQP